MGRSTVYNNITSDEKWEEVLNDNKELMEDFLDYLSSIDRSKETIKQYRAMLKVFFTWNLENNKNKFFINLTKREIAKFQNYAMNEWGWSPKRMRTVKSSMSSLSNYIENILDEETEFKDYRGIVKKIESPIDEAVREKTVLDANQVKFLLDTLVECGKIQQACAVALAIYSGARKSELPRFKVEYINDDYVIFDAMYQTPEKIRTKGRGAKMAKPLTKYILIDFKKYFDLWMDKRKELGIKNEWILVSKDDDGNYIQMKTSTLDSYANTCSRLLNVDYYFHCSRHYLCTLMRSKYNLPPKVIQEYFGWSSSEMIGIYDDSEAIDDFGKYFSKDGIKKVEESSISDITN